MSEHLRHLQPEETEGPEQGRHHRFSLSEDGKELGYAEVIYLGKPVAMYRVLNLQVPDAKGEGRGSRIMEAIERMLIEKGAMGVIEDGIDAYSPARGMYYRHGWVGIPGAPGWHAYNPPKGYDLTRLADLPSRFQNPAVSALISRLRKERPVQG